MAETKKDEGAVPGVASDTDNAKLKHAVELEGDEKGATTTRDDSLDLGVPMLQGDPREPQGPEDAFGPGPKRGDYSQRLGGVNSTTTEFDEDGNLVVVDQNARALERGEVPAEKGGVTTS